MTLSHTTGDAADPWERRVLILHVVNDIGAWGSGFTASLTHRWGRVPRDSYQQFLARIRAEGRSPLGQFRAVHLNRPTGHGPPQDPIWLGHLFAQHGLRSKANPVPLDLDALAGALAQARVWLASRVGWAVVMPRIGCGLAGGTWREVRLIVEGLIDSWPVTVYDLPADPIVPAPAPEKP